MERTHPTSIFAKSDIHSPMQSVFNAPMLANSSGNFRAIGWQTAEVKLHLVSGFILQPTSSLDDDNTLQPCPFIGLMESGKQIDWERPNGAGVNAMMSSFRGVLASSG